MIHTTPYTLHNTVRVLNRMGRLRQDTFEGKFAHFFLTVNGAWLLHKKHFRRLRFSIINQRIFTFILLYIPTLESHGLYSHCEFVALFCC